MWADCGPRPVPWCAEVQKWGAVRSTVFTDPTVTCMNKPLAHNNEVLLSVCVITRLWVI